MHKAARPMAECLPDPSDGVLGPEGWRPGLDGGDASLGKSRVPLARHVTCTREKGEGREGRTDRRRDGRTDGGEGRMEGRKDGWREGGGEGREGFRFRPSRAVHYWLLVEGLTP